MGENVSQEISDIEMENMSETYLDWNKSNRIIKSDEASLRTRNKVM